MKVETHFSVFSERLTMHTEDVPIFRGWSPGTPHGTHGGANSSSTVEDDHPRGPSDLSRFGCQVPVVNERVAVKRTATVGNPPSTSSATSGEGARSPRMYCSRPS